MGGFLGKIQDLNDENSAIKRKKNSARNLKFWSQIDLNIIFFKTWSQYLPVSSLSLCRSRSQAQDKFLLVDCRLSWDVIGRYRSRDLNTGP